MKYSTQVVMMSWVQGITPAILATQKGEITRITVQSPPRQLVHETLSWKNPSQKRQVEWLKV
jgi:hypothetical protein